jgi:uncharacterized phage protein (TIGR01671 family)
MREIKFRAWDHRERKMWKPDAIGNDGRPMKDTGTGFLTSFPEQNPHDPVMQYVGLKDKNGKEIYEGDIVKQDDGLLSDVRWRINGCDFVLNQFQAVGSYNFGFQINKGVEVIGNIYENPELLKEK